MPCRMAKDYLKHNFAKTEEEMKIAFFSTIVGSPTSLTLQPNHWCLHPQKKIFPLKQLQMEYLCFFLEKTSECSPLPTACLKIP